MDLIMKNSGNLNTRDPHGYSERVTVHSSVEKKDII